MLKSQPPVSVKGVAAIGAIVTLAALTGCVTRTRLRAGSRSVTAGRRSAGPPAGGECGAGGLTGPGAGMWLIALFRA